MSRAVAAQGQPLLALLARTTAQTTRTVFTEGHRGVRVFTWISAVTATPALTLTIEVQDPASAQWHILLTSAALSAVTTVPHVMTVYPGIAVTANVTADTHVGMKFRVKVAVGDTDSATYSIGYVLLP